MAEPGRKEKEREARRLAILNAAEKVFAEKDFERVSMDDVAAQAEFSKPTLYQYFSGKEELLFEVAEGLIARYALSVESAGKGDALNRLRAFVRLFYETIRSRPELSALMDRALSQRTAAKRKKSAGRPNRGIALLDRGLGGMYQSFVSAIAEGVADGSVRADTDPKGAAFAVFFLIKGFLGSIAEDARQSPPPDARERDRLSLYALDLVIEGMKPRAKKPR
jgi:AcrR family transcriptional regulator